MQKQQILGSTQVEQFVRSSVGDHLHAQRVLSITNATVGVIHAATLGISAIGRALAQADGLKSKHAIKQVDRLLSNAAIDVWSLFVYWVPYIIGGRTEIVVALDWTDFDQDDHSTLALNMITAHGRATPLMWMTVRKSMLKNWRNAHEDKLLLRLREVVSQEVNVTLLADRGFGDSKLYTLLNDMGFNYIIRFRQGILVTSAEGVSQPASAWVPLSGRPKILLGARVTGNQVAVPAVVCVKAKGMKDSWCLATNLDMETATRIVTLYGRRFSIEENFRDTKNLRFGMGLSATRIASTDRRDRMLLLSALATVLLTFLGMAGEGLGMDRYLKANTDKRRSHSLFFQGCHYYAAIPMMKAEEFHPLVASFGELLLGNKIFTAIFGVI